ncbi:MAG: DUF4876 domain-containing protein [Sphingobacterium sp.]|jgi:hypothetical protein|nr:DUF4876 domain-containing protein [Sphingobacterium sp.]
MNRNLFIIVLLIVSVLSGCKKSEEDRVRPVSLQLTLQAVEGDISFDVSKASIKITNRNTSGSYSATGTATGKVSFASVTPGAYDVSATLVVSAQEYTQKTGIFTAEDVTFNGAIERLDVSSDTEKQLDLVIGKVGNWVFKQIYYAGSDVTKGATFRDQFLEIYNNSNTVLYADSLYIGQVEGKNNNSGQYFLPGSNQYDWSQSHDITVGAGMDANKDYVYANTVFMVPSDGTGKKYPVQPGQSIIIAATAVDHTASYAGNGNTNVVITDPSLTVNLSKADFETNLISYLGGTPYKYDIDNPNVTNMDVTYFISGNDMVLKANGRDAFILLKANPNLPAVKSLPTVATPDQREITAATKKMLQIPVSYIDDAVEVMHPTESQRVPKRLPTSLDAVRTFVPAGQYSSQSLVRKTLKTVNGRRILKDTNNSSEDFGYLNKADVSKSASSFID